MTPGFLTHVAIEKTHVERLPSPYNDCLDNLIEKKFEYLVKRSKTMQIMKNRFNLTAYDQNLCIKMCLQKFIMDNCNCTDFTLPHYLSNHTDMGCNTFSELTCSSTAEADFFNSNAIMRCQYDCPDECIISKYNTKLSTSRYPTQWFIDNLNSSIELKDYKRYVSLVNIFYDDMLYTKIIQNPLITIDSLIGNLGG